VVRERAASALDRIGREFEAEPETLRAAEKELIIATEDSNRIVRNYSVRALCFVRLPPEVAVPVFVRRLEDEDDL
jgi:HEAT repeat protein